MTMSRCAVTAFLSTVGPCPGMIFVFGPAFAMTASSASIRPGSDPPLARSMLGYWIER